MNQKITFHTFFIAKVEFISLEKKFRFYGTKIETAIPCEKSSHAGDALIRPTIDVRFLFKKTVACLFCYVLLIDSRQIQWHKLVFLIPFLTGTQ